MSSVCYKGQIYFSFVLTDINLTFVILHRSLAYTYIVGAFVKSRLATISFVMTVCPSVCMEQLRFLWMDFNEIDIWYIVRKPVEKVQHSLK